MSRRIRNPLALAILGLLLERPMHPYEIRTTLRERHKDTSFRVTPGTLYDTVATLAEHGWIAAAHTERDGNRPERTVYEHTELGHMEFVRWLDELIRVPTPEYPKFLAAVTYLGALGPDRAIDALTERAEHLTAKLDEIRSVLAETVDSGEVPRLFMIEADYAAHSWQSELDWLHSVVADIREGRLTWPKGADQR